MKNATEIIDALGGTTAVARALNLTPSTVSSWKQSGSIPKWRMPGVEALAAELGADITGAAKAA